MGDWIQGSHYTINPPFSIVYTKTLLSPSQPRAGEDIFTVGLLVSRARLSKVTHPRNPFFTARGLGGHQIPTLQRTPG